MPNQQQAAAAPNGAMAGQEKQPKQIQIKANDEDAKGRYASLAIINHTKEEFAVDFLNVLPPSGSLISRIFLSPGHTKRLAKALAENMKKYEEKFGKIDEAKETQQKIGFV